MRIDLTLIRHELHIPDFRVSASLLVFVPCTFRYDTDIIWVAGRSSEVEQLLMVRWVVGSILHGSIELFLAPASAPRLV